MRSEVVELLRSILGDDIGEPTSDMMKHAFKNLKDVLSGDAP